MTATARKPAAPRRPPALPPAGDDEIIEISAPDPEAKPERVPAFKIGETVHTMLKDPPATIGLNALDIQARYDDGTLVGRGEARGYASVYLMAKMLGEASYRALLGCDNMTREQFARINERVTRRAMGALETADGSPNS